MIRRKVSNTEAGIYDIKWSMIVRTTLYPLTLIRTRLQVQTSHSLYTGTFNALTTIVKYEGFNALYKGYWVNSFQLVPYVFYITTYEEVRQQASLVLNNFYLVAFLGGGAGSIVAQLLSVPIDIISQHLMLVGQQNPHAIKKTILQQNNNSLKPNAKLIRGGELERIIVPDSLKKASTVKIVKYLTREIYINESLKGFYRGYFFSTFLVSMNSALWWPFYYFFQSRTIPKLPDKLPTILVQCLCGQLSSLSVNFLTNPLVVLRTRMQVSKQRESAIKVLKLLWSEDSYRLFYKGLTARQSYSCFYSFFIILGYETVKKSSLKKEFLNE